MSLRSIPPWWANPIVFVPVIVTVAFLVAAIAIDFIVRWARG